MIEALQIVTFLLSLGSFCLLISIQADDKNKSGQTVRKILGTQQKRSPIAHDDGELWRREQDAKKGEPR
jgi:hypothetical protein